DVEEPAKPDTEESHHRWIAVGEHDLAVSLGTLAGVESHAGREEGVVGEDADPVDRSPVHGFDLGKLLVVETVRAVGSVPAPGRSERNVADPERHRRLRDAELGGDVL